MAATRLTLLGATGYTGRLTAEAMVRRGLAPRLAGRDRAALVRLGRILDLDTLATDAAELAGHLAPDDVLVSCAGPFASTGLPVLDATLQAGASLVDCAGEPTYLRAAVARHEDAVRGGVVVLPGFGLEFAPGHVAAVAALTAGGSDRVTVLYALEGDHGASRGSRASLGAGGAFALRDGQLVEEPRTRLMRHDLGITSCRAALVGSTESLLLPRVHPGLRTVEVWLGRLRTAATARSQRVPLVERGLDEDERRGPPAARRARSATQVVAWAGGEEVRLAGPNGYELTAELLAAAAARLVGASPPAPGVRGPVDAFGREGARAMTAEAGMVEVAARGPGMRTSSAGAAPSPSWTGRGGARR